MVLKSALKVTIIYALDPYLPVFFSRRRQPISTRNSFWTHTFTYVVGESIWKSIITWCKQVIDSMNTNDMAY